MTLPDRNPQLAPGRVIDTSSGRVQVREVRAPQAATQTVRWHSPGMPMVADWDAETAVRWGFYANVIVFRSVQIIANTIASLPFRAGKPPTKVTDPGDPSTTARLAQMLGPPPGGPAPKLSARRLWAWSIAQRIVTGKHAWEVETEGRRADGAVVALWPLVSAQTRPIPSEGGVEWFSAFEYGPQHRPRKLRPDQVVYGWNPSLNDFRQPESALQAARLDISIAVMQDRYNVAFLKNDARPAALIVLEAFANADEFQAYKEQFQSEFGGPSNAGKMMFHEVETDGPVDVGSKVHVQQLGLSQKDARFIEQHQASLERVAMALGVPWSKLDASGRTFDNASEEDHGWWESTILPQVMDLQDEVNMQLAPRLGTEVGWFDLSGVRALQAPKQVQAVGAPSLMQSRVATLNEARAMVGLPPIEGGDRFLTDEELAVIQGRVLPIEQPSTPELEPPAERSVEPPEPPPAPAPPPTSAPEQRAAEVPEDRAPTAEEQEQRRARIWRTADAVVRTLEAQWERRWRALFTRQGAETIKRLEGKRGRQNFDPGRTADVPAGATGDAPADLPVEQRADLPADPASIFDPVFWRAESTEIAAELYEAVFAAGGARISALFGIAFDLEAAYVADFIEARANQLAGQVTDTTYAAITETLAAGVAEGDGIPALAKRIRDVFEQATRTRSTVIARTEVISAYNGSAATLAAQLGPDVVAGQEWIATRDGRTREDHVDADGQLVLIGMPFSVGGYSMAYPGDPAAPPSQIVQCRCTVAFLAPEEWEAATAAREAEGERRAPLTALQAMLTLLPSGDQFDVLVARRAFQEVAA